MNATQRKYLRERVWEHARQLKSDVDEILPTELERGYETTDHLPSLSVFVENVDRYSGTVKIKAAHKRAAVAVDRLRTVIFNESEIARFEAFKNSEAKDAVIDKIARWRDGAIERVILGRDGEAIKFLARMPRLDEFLPKAKKKKTRARAGK